MRVMVLVKATEESEKGFNPTPETMKMMEEMGKFNEELRKAGILRAADGLKPSSDGKRICVRWFQPHSHQRDFRGTPRVGRWFLALGS